MTGNCNLFSFRFICTTVMLLRSKLVNSMNTARIFDSANLRLDFDHAYDEISKKKTKKNKKKSYVKRKSIRASTAGCRLTANQVHALCQKGGTARIRDCVALSTVDYENNKNRPLLHGCMIIVNLVRD